MVPGGNVDPSAPTVARAPGLVPEFPRESLMLQSHHTLSEQPCPPSRARSPGRCHLSHPGWAAHPPGLLGGLGGQSLSQRLRVPLDGDPAEAALGQHTPSALPPTAPRCPGRSEVPAGQTRGWRRWTLPWPRFASVPAISSFRSCSHPCARHRLRERPGSRCWTPFILLCPFGDGKVIASNLHVTADSR